MPLPMVNEYTVNAMLERMGLPERVRAGDRQDEAWMLMIGHLLQRIEALEKAAEAP